MDLATAELASEGEETMMICAACAQHVREQEAAEVKSELTNGWMH